MAELTKDLQAMLRGWQVLIRGKLYYDQKTKQYYDAEGRQLTYGEVQSRYNFDPMRPQEIYRGTAQISPRTAQITQWQPTEGASAVIPGAEGSVTWGEQLAELEQAAKAMGVSVEDLLRAQYGIPREPTGLTPGQLEQQRQFGVTQAWREGEAGRELELQREMTRAAQYGWGQQRYAHQLRTGGGEEDRQSQRAGQASLWEDWNKRLASSATWPQSEIYETRENPYAPREESIGDLMQQSKAEYEFAKEKADWFRKRMKDPDDTLTRPTSFLGSEQVPATMGDMTPDQMAAQGAFEAEAVTWKHLGDIFASPEGQDWVEWKGKQEKQRAGERARGWGETWGRDLPPKLPPPMPKTPEFLRKVYPELGERLPRGAKGAPMYPLSGQAWGGMAPSERGKWAGYIDWAGGKPEDLYAQMRGMQPEPRRGGGWRPAKQWGF